jgi:hypothetical protein
MKNNSSSSFSFSCLDTDANSGSGSINQLHLAILQINLFVKELVKKGFDVNEKDNGLVAS